MKSADFWKRYLMKNFLIIQTDALLAKPLDSFFFQFHYLGAPFLPRQHTEYFEKRNAKDRLKRFFRSKRQFTAPHPDTYPHLHGNGGLSIRHRIM